MATHVGEHDIDNDITVISLESSSSNSPHSTNNTKKGIETVELDVEVKLKIREIDSPEYLDIDIRGSGVTGHKHTVGYSKISEKLRQLGSNSSTAHSLQCSAFCGGRSCKYENPLRWSKEEGMAFNGLFSHWVTDNILAMARPSTYLFTEYNLIQLFKQSHIGAVINLQTLGEHSHCGPGLEKDGFTYNPEDLMRNDIYFYNYPWPDYGAPMLSSILDVVKVVDFSCNMGKVAIHCHAGLGRTGIVIACYIIYSQRLGPEDAITLVRDKRPGSIQTRGQLDLVYRFANHLSSLWRLYPSSLYSSCNLDEYLVKQARLLHGEEVKKYKYIPKVLVVICKRLCQVSRENCFMFYCKQSSSGEEKIITGDDSKETPSKMGLERAQEKWLVVSYSERSHDAGTSQCCHGDRVRERISNLESEMNTQWQWVELNKETDPTILFLLLFNYLSRLSKPLLSFNDIHSDIFNHISKPQKAVLTLVMDTVKTVIPSSLLQENLQLVSTQLASIFLQKQSSSTKIKNTEQEDEGSDEEEEEEEEVFTLQVIIQDYLSINDK